MKKMMIIFLLGVMSIPLRAQTFNEWWRQKKTQKKYLIKQIAALQVYIGYARKGYDVARDGLKTVSDIQNGEFNLHSNFFSSLLRVNPAVSNSPRAGDIVSMQTAILRQYEKDYRYMKESGMLRAEELEYVSGVYGRLLEDCSDLAEGLTALLTDNESEMTDDERLRRIDRVYSEMQNIYSFCRHFGNKGLQLVQARRSERHAARHVAEWYGTE